ncbi:chloride channel protein [Limnochorda pilosa]|uniref:Chloride channel protein n=1 Tax=Limnochorda pilosa TaxID=1555112 RepID=A0A0K2SFM2_LIMPI|nr:chloride channel protein [Limnochorda pilosa]BAS25901.1 chloride channel protein [Limnochorda pilosa]
MIRRLGWARYRPNLFLGFVVLAGLLAGLASLAFYAATNAAVRYGRSVTEGRGLAVVGLALGGGLLVGLLGAIGASPRFGGVTNVIYGAGLGRDLVGPWQTFKTFVRSVITIGTGGSAGREGPVVVIGAGVAGTLGRWLRVSEQEMRTLLAAGVAAGLAVAFNAPIASSLFALEIILGDFGASTFSFVVLAAVSASVLAYGFLGNQPVLKVAAYTFRHWAEIPLYAGLGIVAGLAGQLYIHSIRRARRLFRRLPGPEWVRPGVGGLIFGAVGVALPLTLGGDYSPIAVSMQGGLSWLALLGLMGAKLFTTSVTLGSGGAGGVFAPGFVIGAFLGGSYGVLMHGLLPGVASASGGYALVGLGAMLSGFTLAPITSILLLFEITRDYAIILPAMVASVAAYKVSGAFGPYNIETLSLHEAGIEWRSGRQINLLREVTASEAMCRQVRTVSEDETVADVVALMQRYRYTGFPVVDGGGRLVGVVTLEDVRETPMDGRLERPVSEVMSREPIVSHPDDTLDRVLRELSAHRVGRVLVVDPADPGRLLGIITKSDVLRAYNERLLRSQPRPPEELEPGVGGE